MGSAESVAAAMSSCVQLPSMAHEENFLTFSGKGGGNGANKAWKCCAHAENLAAFSFCM